MQHRLLLQLSLGLACLAGTVLGQTVKFVTPPKELILNDRKHPVTVAYTGVKGDADIHVDIFESGSQWSGGGVVKVTGPSGQAKVPIEVRIAPNYQGPLTLRTYLTAVGEQYDGRSRTVDVPVTLSQAPTDAIGVLCQPETVVPGRVFVINLWYTQTHAKESDIIAVALHADSKEWYGGFRVEINQQQGTVSGRFDLHRAPLNAPLKFKAWISPRGEEAPNYVSYTMLNIHLGTTTTPTCYDNGIQGWTPQDLQPANWVELKYVPATLGRGSTARIGIAYNLVSATKADMDVSLMTWNWDTHEAFLITGTRKAVTSDKNQVIIDLPIPRDAQPGKDGIYVIAYLTAVAGSYDDSWGEDRKYKVALGNTGTKTSDRDIQAKLNSQVTEKHTPVQYANNQADLRQDDLRLPPMVPRLGRPGIALNPSQPATVLGSVWQQWQQQQAQQMTQDYEQRMNRRQPAAGAAAADQEEDAAEPGRAQPFRQPTANDSDDDDDAAPTGRLRPRQRLRAEVEVEDDSSLVKRARQRNVDEEEEEEEN